MSYKIIEVYGVAYKQFENGGRFKHLPNKYPHLPKHAGVYLLTDSASGLKYVGSSKNVNNRAHSYTSKSGNELKAREVFKDIKPENLTFEILEDCRGLSLIERLKVEDNWILKLGTLKPNGLNSISAINQKKILKIKYTPEQLKKLNAKTYKTPAYVNVLVSKRERKRLKTAFN